MAETVRREGLPVTSVSATLIDFALVLDRDALEAAIGEADRLDLIDPEALRRAASGAGRRPGAGVLAEVLDRRTFVLSRSRLERLFRPIARRAGLPQPQGNCRVNGYHVDFYWPDLGLVVETDGLRYHRTAAQQTRAYLRDQQHYVAELTPLLSAMLRSASSPGTWSAYSPVRSRASGGNARGRLNDRGRQGNPNSSIAP